jgi:hypothetical protein
MSRLIVLCGIIFGGLATSLGAEAPKPGAEHAKLSEFISAMPYEGETDAVWDGTEYGPAGKFTGKNTVRPVLGGFFFIEEWEEDYPSGDKLSGIIVYGYDAKNKYHAENYDSNGLSSNVKIQFPDNHTMTQQFEQTSPKGEKSLVKGHWKYNKDKSEFIANWELSLDNGKTWKHWVTFKGTRTKK